MSAPIPWGGRSCLPLTAVGPLACHHPSNGRKRSQSSAGSSRGHATYSHSLYWALEVVYRLEVHRCMFCDQIAHQNWPLLPHSLPSQCVCALGTHSCCWNQNCCVVLSCSTTFKCTSKAKQASDVPIFRNHVIGKILVYRATVQVYLVNVTMVLCLS